MTAARPAARPRMTRDELIALIRSRHPGFVPPELMVVGIRGYYRDGMGVVGKNDRGMYDDAIFIVAPDGFHAFNGNTDPNGARIGAGTGAGKGMASLKPGVWPVMKLDKHQGKYEALCQRAGPVVVIRDGRPPYEDRGMFGINIHRGGVNGTSSEGCQTLPTDQWGEFIATITALVKRQDGAGWRQTVVTYVLLDGVG